MDFINNIYDNQIYEFCRTCDLNFKNFKEKLKFKQ